VDWEALTTFLREEARVEAELRDDIFSELKGAELEEVAYELARIRVLGPHSSSLNDEPYPVEVDYERRNLKRSDRRFGPVYSGFRFQTLLRELLPEGERIFQYLHVVFTNQRLATWEGGRWHLRVVLLGFPMVISTTGLVEAPAREREYYVLSSVDLALAEKWLAERGEFLDYDDPRLTEVLKGYLWQGLFYHRALLRREEFAFCSDGRCSLYNSHWQRELFQAQLGGQLCTSHRRLWEEGRCEGSQGA
jgi:hypothetical protein